MNTENKLTPLQSLKQYCEDAIWMFKEMGDPDNSSHIRAYKNVISVIDNSLSKEKEFAREMFERGWVDRGYDRQSRQEYFDEIFKQYEQS